MADVESQDQAEKPLTTAELLKSHTVKVVESHMTSTYEDSAISICLEAVHKNKHYKDIAFYVKHQMDKKFPSSGKATEGVFHCVCGKNFASKHTCCSLSCASPLQPVTSVVLQLQLVTRRAFTSIFKWTLFMSSCLSPKTTPSRSQKLSPPLLHTRTTLLQLA